MITTPAPGRYAVDPASSSVTIATKHMFGLGGVTATLALKQAELVVGDPATATTLTAVADAGSFDSKNAQRDQKVHGASFLDVATYPEITLAITGATRTGDAWVGNGTITAHGVTAPVSITLDGLTETGGQVRLTGSTRVDRYAFGVTAMKGMAGRWLDLALVATATRV